MEDIDAFIFILQCLVMAIAELHSATFIAIKRPVVTGWNWP
jgi:hypothetical protein